MVNDTLGEAPVMVALCEICSGASAFTPMVDAFPERTLSFQIHGIDRGTFTVYDYQTQTVWSPFTGRSLEGPLKGLRMPRVPVIVKTWAEWVERYPETDVVLADRRMIETREHGRGEHNEIGDDYIPEGFQKVANLSDIRLPVNELVYGITNGAEDQSVAFPLSYLKARSEILRHPFDNHIYLLENIGDYSVATFRLTPEQASREFRVVSRKPFRIADDQGRSWDEFGGPTGGGRSGWNRPTAISPNGTSGSVRTRAAPSPGRGRLGRLRTHS